MIRSRFSLRSALLACATLLAACAAGSEQLVSMPSQEVELTRPELCRIYVFRSSQVMGSTRTMRVFDQETEIGTLGGDEYLCWERAPGRVLLSAVYHGPRIDRGEQDDVFDLQTEAGKVYYLNVSLLTESEHTAYGDKRGAPRLVRVNAEEGRKLLEESDPAGH